jgi:hypothetical protein
MVCAMTVKALSHFVAVIPLKMGAFREKLD